MPSVGSSADIARDAEGATLYDLGGDLLHPGIGLLGALVIQALNVYKPRGMTTVRAPEADHAEGGVRGDAAYGVTGTQLQRCSPSTARSVLRGTVGNALVCGMRALVEVGDAGVGNFAGHEKPGSPSPRQ